MFKLFYCLIFKFVSLIQVLGQQITDFRMPDVNAVAEKNDAEELGRLLQLILGCAVNCDRKHGK